MSSADLSEPLRTAIVGNAGIAALLSDYKGSEAVFTRMPVPEDAPYPMIVISPDILVDNSDGLNDFQPIITKQVVVWSANDTPANYRLANQIALLIRTLLHRQPRAIIVPSWGVVGIQVRGPEQIFSDVQAQTEGRVLIVEVHLAQRR